MYENSSTNTTIVIRKAATKINGLSITSSSNTFTFTLKNGDEDILKNKKVTLKLNEKTYTAKTNINGVVKFKVKKLGKGTYIATVNYAGSKYYKKNPVKKWNWQ